MSYYPDFLKWQNLEIDAELELLKRQINSVPGNKNSTNDNDLERILCELNKLIGLEQLK